mgnify:CR=1 FL=1
MGSDLRGATLRQSPVACKNNLNDWFHRLQRSWVQMKEAGIVTLSVASMNELNACLRSRSLSMVLPRSSWDIEDIQLGVCKYCHGAVEWFGRRPYDVGTAIRHWCKKGEDILVKTHLHPKSELAVNEKLSEIEGRLREVELRDAKIAVPISANMDHDKRLKRLEAIVVELMKDKKVCQ